MAWRPTRRDVIKQGLAAGCALAGGWEAMAAGEGPGKAGPSVPVAIQRCEGYDPKLVRQRIDAAIDAIGGIGSAVNGKTVTIKINVTGGPGTLAGLPGYRTYHIHPNVLAATCAALHDAGAKRIIVVESQYSEKRPEEVLKEAGWDVPAIVSAGGGKVEFADTRNRGPFASYSTLKVPWGGFLYPAFMVNQHYEKTDYFVSLAKMKDHTAAGITLAAKNLYGMPPTSLYGNEAPKEDTTSFRGDILHNGTKKPPAGVPQEKRTPAPITWKERVPRVTADLVGARPIDLAIIDGVETNRGGEGPWSGTVEPLAPKLLFVGKNAACTDAIAAAAMGYDPQAEHGTFPFPGDNHLRLLAFAGVGEIDPKKIEVRGLALEKAIFPFNPQRKPVASPSAYLRRRHPGAAMA